MSQPSPTPAPSPGTSPTPAPSSTPQPTMTRKRILWMVQTAILAAILVVMAFTPLGYFKYGVVSITFLTLPVVIGAVVVGPACGAVLGFVFGLTSFLQCFGMDVFGTTLFGIDPFLTAVMCFVPRILMGWLVGLIFTALAKVDGTRIASFAVASVSGALLNTVLFVGALVWFFGSSSYLRQFGENIWAILGVLVTFNAAIEAGVVLVVGTAITKALRVAMGDRKPPKAKAA